MRIISMLIALVVLESLIISQRTLAAETANTDETKIKFEIIESISAKQKNILEEIDKIKNISSKQEEFKLEKTEEDIKREKALARFADKIAKTVFPEGKFLINASAYTAAADECGKDDGITASGLLVKKNHTIACPPQFPLGTKIKIEGMGEYVCEDRGGAIKGNHIDIYMETKTEAFAFGRQNLLAEVVS